jgi:four helix bundle protein
MDFKSLLALQKSFRLAMNIFKPSKSFPKEETYSLTDQMRRSFRSVSVTMAEAYRKRSNPHNFTSKLTDSDAENSETHVWLEYAIQCEYITRKTFDTLNSRTLEIGKLINHMINNPAKF